jgi:hypothetical protein
MKKSIIVGLVVGMIFMAGCTANSRAKYWGGKEEFNLPANKKLVNVTWKDNAMWYLVRGMRNGEVAETYEFCEKSGFGMIEGKVIIKEVIKYE